ncbi:hypothetical protein R5R35_013207 [Gryllus longicercus]|uniref:Transposase domain-containing protein n=1 Tax=Gryllus longicercus TaxID=2509291 RepID=A0AAN9W6X2_9ORTH
MDRKRKLNSDRVAKYRKKKKLNLIKRPNDDTESDEHDGGEIDCEQNIVNVHIIQDAGTSNDPNSDIQEETPLENERHYESQGNPTDIEDEAEEYPTEIENEDENDEDEDDYFSADEGDFDVDNEIDNEEEFENEINEEINEVEPEEVEELRQWTKDCRTPHAHLDKLLLIFRRRLLPCLPKSSKTFLRTNLAMYIIEQLGHGEFVYLGILNGLKKIINIDLHENIVDLQINIDGLNLFKSGNKEFWPILCKVHYVPNIYKAFPVAIYYGVGKPSNLDQYLENFIAEIRELKRGFEIDGKVLKINIHSFVCDRPARAFIKGIKGHGGYDSCERCTVHGIRYNRRTIFPEDGEKRTDATFRDQLHDGHHVEETPLLQIDGLDLITHFVLDSMHLCFLGVMKKLLIYWLQDLRYKLGRRQRQILNNILEQLKIQIPCEFNRKPRTTEQIPNWKATEYKLFCLYLGPIILKDILPKVLYDHFMLFSTGCRILFDPILATVKNEQANSYLRKFVNQIGPNRDRNEVYDYDMLVSNVHNLIHLAEDAKNANTDLMKINAFPFESLLGEIKMLLRSANRPLAQVCRRLYERHLSNKKTTIPPVVQILRERQINGYIEIKKLSFKNSTLISVKPNNVVLLKNKTCVIIHQIKRQQISNEIIFNGSTVNLVRPTFHYPVNSKYLNMWRVNTNLTAEISFTINDIEKKMILVNIEPTGKSYVVPLLHE